MTRFVIKAILMTVAANQAVVAHDLPHTMATEVHHNFTPVGFDDNKHFAYWETYYSDAAGCHEWEFSIINIESKQVVERISTSIDDCGTKLSLSTLKATLEDQAQSLIKQYAIKDKAGLRVSQFPLKSSGKSITASLSPAGKPYQEGVVTITPININLISNQISNLGKPQTIGVFREVTFGSIKQTRSPKIAGYITNAKQDRLIIVGTYIEAGHHGPPDSTRIWVRGTALPKE